MSKKLRLQIGAMMILAALVYLGMKGATNFSQYFVTVHQYQSHIAKYSGQAIRVQGEMMANSVHYNPSTQTLRFTLASGRNQLPVQYIGALPTEQFKNASAIVEGQLGQHGVFQATKLMIQCPDHYQAKGGTQNG